MLSRRVEQDWPPSDPCTAYQRERRLGWVSFGPVRRPVLRCPAHALRGTRCRSSRPGTQGSLTRQDAVEEPPGDRRLKGESHVTG